MRAQARAGWPHCSARRQSRSQAAPQLGRRRDGVQSSAEHPGWSTTDAGQDVDSVLHSQQPSDFVLKLPKRTFVFRLQLGVILVAGVAGGIVVGSRVHRSPGLVAFLGQQAIAVGLISALPAAINSRATTTTPSDGATMPVTAPAAKIQRPHVSARP